MTPPSWHVIIVNYRTGALAARAARSARDCAREHKNVTITVVDSASGDDSREEIDAVDGISLVTMPENRGFGAALNAGARDSDADFLLCQNADITFGPELLDRFDRRFAELSTLAVIGPRLVGPDQSIQPSCRHFPTHGSLLFSRGSPLGTVLKSRQRRYIIPEPPSFTLCDVVAGACVAVRRSVWQELGGMDENFFLYAEDTDFCRRAKMAGHLVGYEPAVTALHEWGASTQQDRRRWEQVHAQSLERYFQKHHPDRPLANALLKLALKLNSHL